MAARYDPPALNASSNHNASYQKNEGEPKDRESLRAALILGLTGYELKGFGKGELLARMRRLMGAIFVTVMIPSSTR